MGAIADKLIELWSADRRLVVGVPYRRMASDAERVAEERIAQLEEGYGLIDKMCCDGDSENPTVEKIYVVAHVLSGKCQNPHEDWKAQVEKLLAGGEPRRSNQERMADDESD